MKKIEPERIESKRFEKNIKLFKTLAILAFLVAILKVILTPDILTGGGKLLDFGIFLFPIFLFFEYRRKAKNWYGQFIEWGENDITYKTREKEITIIPYESISDISIKLDEIILTSNQNSFKIMIEVMPNTANSSRYELDELPQMI